MQIALCGLATFTRAPIGTKKWRCTAGWGREFPGILERLEPLFTPKNLLVYTYTLDLISRAGQTEIPDFRVLIWTANQLLGGFDFRDGAEKVEVHVHP